MRKLRQGVNQFLVLKLDWWRSLKWLIFFFINLTCLMQCSGPDDNSAGMPQKKLLDDTVATIVVANKEITVIEGFDTTYQVSLSKAPSSDVTIEINLEDTIPPELDVAMNPTTITFTSDNFDQPQLVIISYKSDKIVKNNFSYFIKHEPITGDPDFAAILPSNFPRIKVNLIDNDDDTNTDSEGNRLINNVNVDADGDGLIEISTALMLNNMRFNLAGSSYKTSEEDDFGDSGGCPNNICNGYELTTDIDLLNLLDKNGDGEIKITKVEFDINADNDSTDKGEELTVIDITIDKSWEPIGTQSEPFTAIFDGNDHTITNLWVNVSTPQAGFFGRTAGNVHIKNIGVTSGSIYSSSNSSSHAYSGGLVGYFKSRANEETEDSLTITNSYFCSRGGILSFSPLDIGSASYSGGLVGYFEGRSGTQSSLTITNSYFIGNKGVYASSSMNPTPSYRSGDTTNAYSGGLVGYFAAPSSSLTIVNSYFRGWAGVFSSGENAASGGLVGSLASSSSLTIMSSYFSGKEAISSISLPAGRSSKSAKAYSGGLVGRTSNPNPSIANSYWNTDAPHIINSISKTSENKLVIGDIVVRNLVNVLGYTSCELKATDTDTNAGCPTTTPLKYPEHLGDAWDLSESSKLPMIKKCIPTVTGATTDWAICESYGNLLEQQDFSSPLPVDRDGDGLIEIYTAQMFNNMRYDLAGAGYKTSEEEDDLGDSTGCPQVDPATDPPTYRCNGYELTRNINLLKLLDANKNGHIDTIRKEYNGESIDLIDVAENKDRSWVPIGDSNTNAFTGIFEGNSHTIANLWVNISNNSAGLFGVTDGNDNNVQIRNVGVISGSIFTKYAMNSDGLVARDAGGLVGKALGYPGGPNHLGRGLIIINSYFKGHGGVIVWAPGIHSVKVGGLVGRIGRVESSGSPSHGDGPGASLTIKNSYFSADYGVFVHGKARISSGLGGSFDQGPRSTGIAAGGLVGVGRDKSSITIEDSYFSGSGNIVTSRSSDTHSFAGGLVGDMRGKDSNASSYLIIKRSYFAGEGRIIAHYSNPIIASTDIPVSKTFQKNYWNRDTVLRTTVKAGVNRRGPILTREGLSVYNREIPLINVASSLTLEQLKAISGDNYPSNLPNSATDNTKSWNLGDISQLPAIKRCINPTIGRLPDNDRSIAVICESYNGLLNGQR